MNSSANPPAPSEKAPPIEEITLMTGVIILLTMRMAAFAVKESEAGACSLGGSEVAMVLMSAMAVERTTTSPPAFTFAPCPMEAFTSWLTTLTAAKALIAPDFAALPREALVSSTTSPSAFTFTLWPAVTVPPRTSVLTLLTMTVAAIVAGSAAVIVPNVP